MTSDSYPSRGWIVGANVLEPNPVLITLRQIAVKEIPVQHMRLGQGKEAQTSSFNAALLIVPNRSDTALTRRRRMIFSLEPTTNPH